MWRIFATFVIVACIIYLSYLASKYVGRGMSKGSNSRYMRLIDQLSLGQDRHIAVVQVGEVSARRGDRRADQHPV